MQNSTSIKYAHIRSHLDIYIHKHAHPHTSQEVSVDRYTQQGVHAF